MHGSFWLLDRSKKAKGTPSLAQSSSRSGAREYPLFKLIQGRPPTDGAYDRSLLGVGKSGGRGKFIPGESGKD